MITGASGEPVLIRVLGRNTGPLVITETLLKIFIGQPAFALNPPISPTVYKSDGAGWIVPIPGLLDIRIGAGINGMPPARPIPGFRQRHPTIFFHLVNGREHCDPEAVSYTHLTLPT